MILPESIRRSSTAGAGLAISFLLGCFGCSQPPSPDTRPNVVLIVVDTLRPDFLGVYGHAGETSPNVDALGEKSVVFDRAIAASSLTAPSHASIMSSRYVREHSVGYLNGGTRLVGVETLASIFHDAGYDTAAFISNSIIRSRVGLDHGFDVYDDSLPGAERNRPYIFERTAPGTTERALAWLESPERKGRPFFLWVHYQDPHGPYTPPKALAEAFAASPEPGEEPLPVLDNQRGLRGIPTYQALPGLRFASEYRGRYAAEVRYFDDGLGRVLEAVRKLEGPSGTVVLFTADHAESFGEGGFYMAHGHATTPDLARVPFMLSAPGLAAGRSDELVHHVDVMPTLLDLAGLPIPDTVRGVALGNLLSGDAEFPARLVFSDVGNDVSAYQEDVFVRVSAKGEEATSASGRWASFRWSDDDSWTPSPLDESLRSTIAGYLDHSVPTEPAGEEDPADIERLRALGYVDP